MTVVSGDTGNGEARTQFLIDFPEAYGNARFSSRGSLPYSDTLRNHLIISEKTIRIAVPFVDDYGVDFLIGCLSANDRRPHVELVVRRVPRNRIPELQKVGIDLFILDEDDDRWGFHAKYAIFDDMMAIIGSENLTERNMKRNLEIGVITGRRISAMLLAVHKNLLAVSTRAH